MRLGLILRGVVQGVGFRPFVRRSALARGLAGSVTNARDAVCIEVEGAPEAVESFARSLEHELPPAAEIRSTERALLADRGDRDFIILKSELGRPTAPVLPPDLAPCAACWAEVFDRSSRRYRYPFTSCASCGPRHSIALGLPYDRERTTMSGFAMCAACRGEYEDVDDRRYHAQPIACPACGPQLRWCDPHGEALVGEAALARATEALRAGVIVALRGLGGFQLLVDATREDAVARLRARKRRPHKPLAVLFATIEDVRVHAELDAAETTLLGSPAAPIVLVERCTESTLARSVSGEVTTLGAMLPASPLHALLARDMGRPLVCTSGNRSGEPMATTVEEARAQLAEVVDGFLTHDRPIARPLDDSVVRVVAGGAPMVLRRARGHSPGTIGTARARTSGLALGAHMKSTVTLVHEGTLVPSQHLGDQGSVRARELLERSARELCEFFDARPRWIACDAHPEYASTRLGEALAAEWGLPLMRIQHHHAHVAACIAEHGAHLAEASVLGLAWDGTGWGDDGALWGGEALLCDRAQARRVASLRPFPLPGGESVATEPRRAALGLLYRFAPGRLPLALSAWPSAEEPLLRQALERGINAPSSSSIGRLFDAVAVLLGRHPRTSFEGQAAIALEQLATTCTDPESAYPLPLDAGDLATLDTQALVEALLADLVRSVDRARIARRFHNALISAAVAIAERAGRHDVVIAGGCFQNRLLSEGVEAALRRRGHLVWRPQRLPPNDGAISIGQAWLASLTGDS